jgi:nucleotide-binding universal stress UspA family protein
MYRRIVVPLDGSDVAAQALPQAEELANQQSIPIVLLHVIDLNELDHFGLEVVVGRPALADQLQTEVQRSRVELEQVAAKLRERGLDASVQIRAGNPAREIAATAVPGDLLVMSTHGRGGPARWVLGSVAEAVVRHASVPVMLIRAQFP